MGVTETRDAELQMLTPDGIPALNEYFGIKPQRIVVDLGADGVWANLHSVEMQVWLTEALLAYQNTPNMGFGPQRGGVPWVRLGGYSLTIDGYEPMLGSLSTNLVVNWDDTLRFEPGRITAVAESLHKISAA